MKSLPPHIAVVDDEPPVLKALQRLLSSAGFSVETHASGVAFVQSLTRAGALPGVLVLDLHMPHMSGFEVLARLAEAGVLIPVVIITGHDTPENHERALAGGAVAYLCKPVDGQALTSAITGALGRAGP